ncbi:MAG: TolC family protein [Limnospira sp.]
MPVLRYFMAVGVSGAIVFFNIGGGEAVPPPIKQLDRVSEPHSTRESGSKHNSTKFSTSGNSEAELSEHPTPVESEKASGDLSPSQLANSDRAENVAISVQKPDIKPATGPAIAGDAAETAPPSVEVAIGDPPTGEGATPGREPAQLAQVAEPALQVPDLTPPTEPYPQPYPDGTLRTDPPAILFPSSNPLYFPTQPDQVEIQETVPITLEQALDLARRNNEEIAVLQLQVDQSLASLRVAQAELYPSLSFTSSLLRSESASGTISTRAQNRRIRNQRRQAAAEGQDIQDQTPFAIPFGSTSFDNSIQIQYDFGLSGARGARIREAEEQLRAAELELERVVEETYLNVTDTYYTLQAADATVEIQRAAVRNAQKSLEDAEALERAGVGTRFEVLQARVTLASSQQDLTNAISNQKTARRNLSVLVNVSQNANLVAADPIALAGTWEFTLDETIVLAYKNRPELEQQLIARNVAEERRQQALAATRPNLTAAASYNVLGLLSDDASPFANQGWADGYSVQVQLQWNFFDGGAAKARARQQELDIAIAEERFSQTRNQIRRGIEESFYDLQASFENIGVANLGVEEATEALRLARLRFQAGVGTQTDVINQETSLTRAQNQLLQAIIGYNRALAQLRRAVSNLPGSILQDRP